MPCVTWRELNVEIRLSEALHIRQKAVYLNIITLALIAATSLFAGCAGSPLDAATAPSKNRPPYFIEGYTIADAVKGGAGSVISSQVRLIPQAPEGLFSLHDPR